MVQLDITIATKDNQPIVSEILEETREWLRGKGINQWFFPFTSEWVNKHIERQEFFLARQENLPVGVFRLTRTDPIFWGENSDNAMYIHSLAVRRKWKGQGIGRYLLEWSENYSVNNHYSYLRLDCMAENSFLCKYYEQTGFTSCGTKEIQIGEIQWKAKLYQKVI